MRDERFLNTADGAQNLSEYLLLATSFVLKDLC